MANMRHDPDWADHAREDYILEKLEEKRKNEESNKSQPHGRIHCGQGEGVSSQEPKLLTGGLKDGV